MSNEKFSALAKIECNFGSYSKSYRLCCTLPSDYKVFDKDDNLIAYAEVKGRYRSIASCYPLPIACRKVVKLCDKRLNPVMIWACDDGIVYGQPAQLDGYVKWGGRKPREGAVNDQELMIYYDKQKTLRYFRYY